MSSPTSSSDTPHSPLGDTQSAPGRYGLALLLLFVVLVTRLPAITPSFWGDELKTMHDVSGSLLDTLKYQAFQGGHPPFYYLCLNLWTKVSNSDIWIRLLSVGAGLATVLIVGRIGFEFGGSRTGWIAAFFAATTHPLCWIAAEARNYVFHVLFGALAWLFLIRAIKFSRTKYWIGYAVSLALCWYSFYYGYYVGVGLGLFFLATRPKRRALIAYTASSAFSVLLYLPWLPIFLKQMGRTDEWQERLVPPEFTLLGLIRLDIRAFGLHGPWNLFGTEVSPRFGAPPTEWLIILVVGLSILILVLRSRTQQGLSTATRRWLVPSLIGLGGYLISSNATALVGAYTWLKYLSFAGIPLCICGSLLAAELPLRLIRYGLPVALIINIAATSERAFTRKTPHWRQAVTWTQEATGPRETLITSRIASLAVQHYGSPELQNQTRFLSHKAPFGSLEGSVRVMSKTAHGAPTDQFLERFASEAATSQGQLIEQTTFAGNISIQHWQFPKNETPAKDGLPLRAP